MAQFLKYLEQVASGVFNRDASSAVSESIPGLMVNDADWAAWESAVNQWDPEYPHLHGLQVMEGTDATRPAAE